MNKHSKVLCFFICTASVTVAHASFDFKANKAYLRADLGYNFFINPTATTSSFFDNTKINATHEAVANHTGYMIGAGCQVAPGFRSDVTFTYRPSIGFQLTDDAPEVGDGHLTNYTLMLNGYYDFKINSSASPYLMAGIGASKNRTDSIAWPLAMQFELGKSETHLAWQAGAGITYPLAHQFSADFNYQFVSLGKFSNTGHFDVGSPGAPSRWKTLYSNQVQIGLRYFL